MATETSVKEIRSVTMHRVVDTDPDLSYLGSYSNTPESPYAIDRRTPLEGDTAACSHCGECITYVVPPGIWGHDTGTEHEDQDYDQDHDAEPDSDYVGHGWDPHTYRYFNPSEAYDTCTDAERSEFQEMDFNRMESYNAGEWHMVGIYAQAEILVANTIQTVRSGGLWGIESDSDDDYFTEIETEELGDLTLILKELGFSQDAIEEAYADLSDAE